MTLYAHALQVPLAAAGIELVTGGMNEYCTLRSRMQYGA